MKTYSCFQYCPLLKYSDRIAYVYQLEGHQLRFDLCRHRLVYISHNLSGIAYVIGRIQATIQSSLLSTGLQR